jgi:hypothetical protein
MQAVNLRTVNDLSSRRDILELKRTRWWCSGSGMFFFGSDSGSDFKEVSATAQFDIFSKRALFYYASSPKALIFC